MILMISEALSSDSQFFKQPFEGSIPDLLTSQGQQTPAKLGTGALPVLLNTAAQSLHRHELYWRRTSTQPTIKANNDVTSG